MKVVKLILLSIVFASVKFAFTKDTTDAPHRNLNSSVNFEQLDIRCDNSNQEFDFYLTVNQSSSKKIMILI